MKLLITNSHRELLAQMQTSSQAHAVAELTCWTCEVLEPPSSDQKITLNDHKNCLVNNLKSLPYSDMKNSKAQQQMKAAVHIVYDSYGKLKQLDSLTLEELGVFNSILNNPPEAQ